MRKVIAIGLGHAWREQYGKTIRKLQDEGLVKLVGTVDSALAAAPADLPTGDWHVRTVREVPAMDDAKNIVPIILTPDHYRVIEDLARIGFKNIFCEKPLVSRMREIEKLRGLDDEYGIKLYATDFYLPKTLGLQAMRGLLKQDDPRYQWLTISDPNADFANILGEIEGVGVQIIEAGDFCVPDIAGRRYLAEDKEIGGMILDLITHACGPLERAGLFDEHWMVVDASLSRLSNITSGELVPLKNTSREVEMYVTALIDAWGIPIHLSFGKVPIEKGGLWSLTVRGKRGMYYAGLRTGQPAILVGNDGRVITFQLKMTTYEFVMREAFLYFDGKLPGFDGNHGAFLTSMKIGEEILEEYSRARR